MAGEHRHRKHGKTWLPANVTTNNASFGIASVVEVRALGTVGGTDYHGIMAEVIGCLKIGAIQVSFSAAVTETRDIGPTGDFIVREAT